MIARALEGSVERRTHIAHVNFCLSVCGCIFFVNVRTRGKRSAAPLEKLAKDGMNSQIKMRKGYWEREESWL